MSEKKGRPRWVLWSGLAILGLYGLLVLLLWRMGLLSPAGEGSDVQIVVAVLGLVGGLFAASITFLGVLIKQSVDERNLRLAEEAEDRLQLEASIRAVDLLSTPDGSKPPKTKQAGALFALVHLGQLELAVTLVNEMWPAGDISDRAALSILDEALESDDVELQTNAAWDVVGQAKALVSDDGYTAPTVLSEWRTSLDDEAREILMRAVIEMMTEAAGKWERTGFSAFLDLCERIRQRETVPRIRAAASMLAFLIVEILEHMYGEEDAESGGNLRERARPIRDDLAAAYDQIRPDWEEKIRALRWLLAPDDIRALTPGTPGPDRS
jgi:hypothetical protein